MKRKKCLPWVVRPCTKGDP